MGEKRKNQNRRSKPKTDNKIGKKSDSRKIRRQNLQFKDSGKEAANMARSSTASASLLALSAEDKWSIFTLLILYTLQGVPMGLCGSIPMLMKERGASYEQLSLFSLVSFPFSLKLIWAPLVDSLYFQSYGRRKSWLIPIQITTGLAMYAGSFLIESWLGGNGSSMDVLSATIYFFSLYFLMATQDIAVDGWALTMLSKESVGYASICNTIGQTLGVLFSNQGFIAFSDATWCQRYLGFEDGATLVTLPGFIRFWSYVFLFITFLVAIFKTERKDQEGDEIPCGILETYSQVLKIIRKRPVQLLALVLLTCKVAFAAADSVFSFRLIDYGMPKADIAMLSPALLIISIVLPAYMGGIVAKRPLEVFTQGVFCKVITSGLLWACGKYAKSYYGDPDSHSSHLFFGILFLVMILHDVAGNLIFVAIMTFFSTVSDPAIGGTYMTLLNTLANLGHKWPTSLALYILPKVSAYACTVGEGGNTAPCEGPKDSGCVEAGGKCEAAIDGFTVLTAGCMVFGGIWCLLFKSSIAKLEKIPLEDWRVTHASKNHHSP